MSLQWRHNDRDSVSNHQPHDCLLNGLFRGRSKKTLKFRVTGLCAGNLPVTGEFPAQMASNSENVSIWWRHHVHLIWMAMPWMWLEPSEHVQGLLNFTHKMYYMYPYIERYDFFMTLQLWELLNFKPICVFENPPVGLAWIFTLNDGVMTWTHFPYYWSIVSGTTGYAEV